MSKTTRDAGFTMVETMVTVAIVVLLLGLSVVGYQRWAAARQQSGTAREIQTILRSAHQRAITEGNAVCVMFESLSYTVYRGTCGDAGKVKVSGPYQTESQNVTLVAPSFAGQPGATFYARGIATAGSVDVHRAGSTKVYTLTVEGLTGRVSLH